MTLYGAVRLVLVLLSLVVASGYVFRPQPRSTSIRCSVESLDRPDVSGQLLAYKNTFPHITEEQWAQLVRLCEAMLEWNTKVNLISRKDAFNIVPNHIVPCLALSLLRRFQPGETVIDVGTGGGLPGIPMSIINPYCHVTLLDSNSKKMAVVNDLVQHLGLSNVDVVCARAEAVAEHRTFDFMLGRAVSAIPTFLGFSSHLMADVTGTDTDTAADTYTAIRRTDTSALPMTVLGGEGIGPGLLYLKGGDFDDELTDAGVKTYSTFAVSALVPGLQSDKLVLHIPAAEVRAFHGHKMAAAAAAAAATTASGGGKAKVKGKRPTRAARRRAAESVGNVRKGGSGSSGCGSSGSSGR